MNIPVWKIKREIKRLISQIQQIPWLVFSSTIRRKFDENSYKSTKYHHGDLKLTSNVAVLLVYQPDGIQRSTYITLSHLASNAFIPIVVSNTALSLVDCETLKQHSHLVIERPNFGYDFGGYREAIMFLLKQGITPDNLLVVNDSIWFPIYENCEFLTEIKGETTELYGLVINDQYKDRTRHHIQSYLFNFKKSVFCSDAFKHYWENLFLSNNKHAVIRQCEIKMTEYFRSLGFSTGSKYTIADVYAALQKVTSEEFGAIIRYQLEVDPKRTRFLSRYVNREDAMTREYLINEKLMGKYFLISHPLLLLKYLQCPVLKKDRQYIYQLQRNEIFESGLEENLLEVVREEVRSLRLMTVAATTTRGMSYAR